MDRPVLSAQDSREFDLIARLFEPLARGYSGALGLRDDAALLAPPDHDTQRVVTTDCLVAGVHFNADDPPASIAAKALRVNLSDLAAMGAAPEAYTLAVAIPKGTAQDWLDAFAHQLGEDQAQYAVSLIGGDTVSTPGPMTLSITAIGQVPAQQALQRSTASPGDNIYVSGTLGDGALGLLALRGDLSLLSQAHMDDLIARYHFPQPRTVLGQLLRQTASACADISDGLVSDLGHICATSNCCATIEADALPLSQAARAALDHDAALRERVLRGGDDYELVFSAPPARDDKIAALARDTGVDITRIGSMNVANSDAELIRVQGSTGQSMRLGGQGGYEHNW